jgi:hypothetical protein
MTTTSEQPRTPAAELARKMWRTLEPYHGIVYFTPHADEAYARLGIKGRDAYFASRAAPLGAVSAELVISTFYNFHPGLVRHAIPSVWDKASPSAILAARLSAVDLALREVLGDQVNGHEMADAAALAEQAARAASIEGRPLFAGHASLPWPDAPHLVLWHAITLLREYRGDGHIAALVTAGLDPCEALVTHAAANDNGIGMSVLRASRSWPDDEWEAAQQRLRERGLLDGEILTDAGLAVRDRVEASTDEAAAAAWAAITPEEAGRLRTVVRPWSRAVAESDFFGLR